MLPRAPGMGDTSGLVQPPGCSEATFTGASFDLQELSMEAVRMVVDVLSRPDDFQESVIHTLTLHDGTRRVPPNWRVASCQANRNADARSVASQNSTRPNDGRC